MGHKIKQFLEKYPNKSERVDKEWVYDEIIDMMQQEDAIWA